MAKRFNDVQGFSLMVPPWDYTHASELPGWRWQIKRQER